LRKKNIHRDTLLFFFLHSNELYITNPTTTTTTNTTTLYSLIFLSSIQSKPVNRETGSCFESTVYTGGLKPGQHPKIVGHNPGEDDAFSVHVTTRRFEPQAFLQKGTGLGGTSNTVIAEHLKNEYKLAHALVAPIKAGAKTPRPNPPNTDFRKYYERSDLPCSINHATKKALNWKVDVSTLDYHHFLPIFFSGLREIEEPFCFVSEQGMKDMLHLGTEEKVLPAVPQLILPIKDAMSTRDERIMVKTLKIIQALVGVGTQVGMALVPYYRQILPIVSIYAGKSVSLGDKMDFNRKGHLGEIIQETLQKMEMGSGPDAYINIKYMVPTYESCMLV